LHRFARLFLTLLLLVGLPGSVAAEVRPTAQQAAESMGKGFNLGQMFDNTQHPATLETARLKIDAYYARGFRIVRIPVTWTEAVDGTVLADVGTGRVDRAAPRLAQLLAVIDYALSRPDMYVVLNAHHEVRLKDQGRPEVLARLWADISDILGDRDGRLLFEILNEPHLSDKSPMRPETLRAMTGQAYERIRGRDPRRIVVIGGNQWFGAHEMAIAWPDLNAVGSGLDPYVMATFHHYNPWTFNGDNQGDYADPWTEADVTGPMQVMADWAASTGRGMPVFIGEWGVGWNSRYPIMNCNNIRLWYERFDAVHARAFGMPTAVWDDGGWFQAFDHEAGAFSSNLVECIDGSCTWDGRERFNRDCG
jgi:hypothetical protein